MIQALAKLQLSGITKQLIRTAVSIGLAIAILMLVRLDLLLFAALLAVVSKWQILIGGPRLWLHNLWDNAADIAVLWSFIALLVAYQSDPALQWAMTGVYLLWQLSIKPLEGDVGHGLQSLFMLGIAANALFLYKGTLGIAAMVLLGWIIGYISAYHYLTTSEDSQKYLLSGVWALLTAQLVWIFAHWLVLYAFFDGRLLLPQAVLVLIAMGYVLGGIYHDHSRRQLAKRRLFGYLGTMGFVLIGLAIGSEWVAQL